MTDPRVELKALFSPCRKKPVVVQVSVPVRQDNVNDLATFIVACGARAVPVTGGVMIPTLEGDMLASIGDRIVCGVKGEFYPIKPEIYAETYEANHRVPLPVSSQEALREAARRAEELAHSLWGVCSCPAYCQKHEAQFVHHALQHAALSAPASSERAPKEDWVCSERRFPILRQPGEHGVRSVPWSLIWPHGEQARLNHGEQSLERLVERGGLSPVELWYVVHDSAYGSSSLLTPEYCEAWLSGMNDLRIAHIREAQRLRTAAHDIRALAAPKVIK